MKAGVNRRFGVFRILGILGALMLLASCEYKELCYDHRHWMEVEVRFDWQNAPGALLSRASEELEQGAGMTVLFYDMENPDAEPIRYDLPGKDGGIVRLVPGTYRAIAYNYNTETILYRGMEDMDMLEAYTRQSSIEEGTQLSRSGMPRASSTEGEPVILEPDPLWAASTEPFTLTTATPASYSAAHSRSSEEGAKDVYTIVMKPEPRVRHLTVTIHNVPNLQYTSQFGGALSGLAPSVWMVSGVPGDGLATEAFTCQAIDETTLQMQLRIFGHCPHSDDNQFNVHLLTIYAILADGTKWYYTEDVTAQMHGAGYNPNEYEVTIELEGLPVPKPIVNGSGFRPTIDGWASEEILVDM